MIFLRRLSTLAIQILFVYVLLWVCRLIFIMYNYEALGAFESSEYWDFIAGALRFDTANVGYTFGIFAFMSLLPLSPQGFNSKWYRYSLLALFGAGILLVVILNMGDTIYFHFARKRFTADELHFAQNNNNFTIFLKSTLENWQIALSTIVLIIGSIKFYLVTRLKKIEFRAGKYYYIIFSILPIVSVAMMVFAMRGGFGRDTRPITLSNAAAYAQSPLKAAAIISNPFCVLRTLGEKETPIVNFYSQEELKQYFTAEVRPTVDSLYGSQKGKNLVIIVLESFSAEHSKLLYPHLYDNQQTITPFLDSLMNQGYTFTGAHSNGFKSIDALPAILSSIPSLDISFSITPAALSESEGLGDVLSERGYNTSFYNGSPSGSMGYDASARLAGVRHFYAMEDYADKYGEEEFDGYWGIWDLPFLEYFSEELSNTPQPFFSTLFTLTSHHPFVVPSEYEDSLPDGHTAVHKAVAYTDLALKNFFEVSSNKDWYSNTLFILVADHPSSERYSKNANDPKENSHIIYTIFTPDGSLKGFNSMPTSHIDIFPSMMHLFGHDRPIFSFGGNIFDADYEPMAIASGGGYYELSTPHSSKRYTLEELRLMPSDSLSRLKAIIQNYGERLRDHNFQINE